MASAQEISPFVVFDGRSRKLRSPPGVSSSSIPGALGRSFGVLIAPPPPGSHSQKTKGNLP
jgi:hypothetical protein